VITSGAVACRPARCKRDVDADTEEPPANADTEEPPADADTEEPLWLLHDLACAKSAADAWLLLHGLACAKSTADADSEEPLWLLRAADADSEERQWLLHAADADSEQPQWLLRGLACARSVFPDRAKWAGRAATRAKRRSIARGPFFFCQTGH
jgi:hypothetical protein